MTEELIERLERHALGSADEDTMRRWDGIRAYFKGGDRGASHPRDCFESIIDCYAEDCAEAAATLRAKEERIAALEAERDHWKKEAYGYNWQKGRTQAAELKLSKAVKALNRYAHGYCGEDTARATLKEIGGDIA